MKRTTQSKVAIALALASIPLLTGCGSGTKENGVGVIPGAIMIPGVGNCVPLTTPIPFTISNAQSYGSGFTAGRDPYSGQQYGSVTIGTAGIAGGTTYSNTGINSEASLTMTVATPPSYGGVVNATGTLTLLQVGQSMLTSAYQSSILGYGYGSYPTGTYPGYTPTNPAAAQGPCVSGLAFSGNFMQSQPVWVGSVAVYLNGTTHGSVLQLQ